MKWEYYYYNVLDSEGHKHRSVRVGISRLQLLDHFTFNDYGVLGLKKIPQIFIWVMSIFAFLFPWIFAPKRERMHICYKLGSMLSYGRTLPESLEKCAADTGSFYLRQVLLKAQLLLASGKGFIEVFAYIIKTLSPSRVHAIRNIQDQKQLSEVLIELGRIYKKKATFMVRVVKENTGLLFGIGFIVALSKLVAKYVVFDVLFAMFLLREKPPDSVVLYYQIFEVYLYDILMIIGAVIFMFYVIYLLLGMVPVIQAYTIRILARVLFLKICAYPIYKIKLLDEVIFLMRSKFALQDSLFGGIYANRTWITYRESKRFAMRLYMGQHLLLCLSAIKIFRKSELGDWVSALTSYRAVDDLHNIRKLEEINLEKCLGRFLAIVRIALYGFLLFLIAAAATAYMMGTYAFYASV